MNSSTLDGLPLWLQHAFPDVVEHMTKDGRERLAQFISSYHELCGLLGQLPPNTTLYEIYKVTPDALTKFYGDVYTGLAHACEAMIGRWSFQHAHKTSASLQGFRYALEQGNFLVAFVCARAMFEEAAHFHYFLDRVEFSFKKAQAVATREGSNLRGNKMSSANAPREYLEAHITLLKVIRKALEGTDYDWKGWYERVAKESGVDASDLAQRDTIRKTHVNDCIRFLEERRGIPAVKMYDLFCEMVHPNFGSGTLVVSTRKRVNDVVGELVLSSSPRNAEAARWFFEHAAPVLTDAFRVEVDCTRRAQVLLQFYMDLAETHAKERASLPL